MAGNKELIDEIVDPIAVKQVTDLNAKILQLEASFLTAAKSASAFNSAAGGASTNSAFVKNVNESNKAVKNLIDTQEKLTKTIISNSQDEVDAYNKARQGEDGITEAVTKRNRAEAQAANEGAARSSRALKQQADQAKEYIRAQGLIEKLQIKLKGYKLAQLETTDPRALEIYNSKIQKTELAIRQLSNVGKTGFDSLGNAVAKSGNLFQTIGQKIVTLARILPGIGVVGLIAFATEPILEYIQTLDIFSSKISSTATNLKNFNEIMGNAAKEAGEQSTKLEILYKAATDVNNSMKGRIDAARELQKEFTKTFGNLTKEAILNGDAARAYDITTDAIISNAKARAAANKISELAGKLFEADVLNQKIEIANNNERVKLERDAFNRTVDAFKFEQKRRGLSTQLTQEQLTNIKKVSDASIVSGIYEKNVAAQTAKDKNAILKKSLEDQIALIKKVAGGDNVIATTFGNGDGGKAESDAAKKAADDAKKRAEELLKIARDSAVELRELQNEYEKQIEDARKRGEKAEMERLKKELKDKEDLLSDANNKRLLENSKGEDEALNLLTSRYKAGLITLKEYEDGRAIIEQEANLLSIDSAIQLSEDLIAVQKKYGENTQSEEDKLAKLRLSRSKLVRDGIIADLKTEAEARKQLKDLTKQVAEEAAQFVITLVNAGFENRKNKIQEQINLTDENAKAEIDAVNRSLISNSDKADKIKLIEAQADAQKKQLQREQKRVDQEKAKFDKAVSIARIIEATAIAEIQALSYLSNPLTAPLYPGIAGLIAALGAIQLATVLATPIPAYEKGTKNAKGGTSLVGEKGVEYVITPQGATFLTPNKPTLMDIPKGSTVIPHLQTARMMDVQKYAGGQAIDMSEVVRAIERKKFTNGKTVMNGWHKEVRASSNWDNRKKQYFIN